MGPFVSYEENSLLCIKSLEQYSRHLIFFVAYEWAH